MINKDNYTNEEDGSSDEYHKICQIAQIHKLLPDENDHYGVQIEINVERQKFIIDTGSPVTIMPFNYKILGETRIYR